MKKQNLRSLRLNKKSVSNLYIYGGQHKPHSSDEYTDQVDDSECICEKK